MRLLTTVFFSVQVYRIRRLLNGGSSFFFRSFSHVCVIRPTLSYSSGFFSSVLFPLGLFPHFFFPRYFLPRVFSQLSHFPPSLFYPSFLSLKAFSHKVFSYLIFSSLTHLPEAPCHLLIAQIHCLSRSVK